MKRTRLQIGVRLMLLLVALVAACLAWLGLKRELQRQRIKAELDSWEHSRRIALTAPVVSGREGRRRTWLAEIDAKIARQRELRGEQAAE
ncbi:MAG: hypothetical protein WD738_08200 [Pirellulales bacterium]